MAIDCLHRWLHVCFRVPKNENDLSLPGRKIRLLTNKHGVAWVDHLLTFRLSDRSQLLSFRGFEMQSNYSTYSTQRWMYELAPELHLWKSSEITGTNHSLPKEIWGGEGEKKNWKTAVQSHNLHVNQAGNIGMHVPFQKETGMRRGRWQKRRTGERMTKEEEMWEK